MRPWLPFAALSSLADEWNAVSSSEMLDPKIWTSASAEAFIAPFMRHVIFSSPHGIPLHERSAAGTGELVRLLSGYGPMLARELICHPSA